MDGSTRLVNHSPQQPGSAFFHQPKMPSYLRQQFPRPYRPASRKNQDPYLPMAQRDYSNYDANKPRSTMRRAVDYSPTVVRQLEARVWQRDDRDSSWVQPDPSYGHMLLPPASFRKNATNAITTKFVHCSTNKVRCPVFCVVWTPEGRRLVTGASSGEFTLWNGLTFNFETILQAHDYSIRSMCWSHNDLWLLSGDDMGYVKYWQSNMNNVQMFQAHKDQAIRGVSVAPTDSKFASCSDDGTVRVWDFLRCHEERIMRGHGADVRCVDWHQQKGLIVSGSKDNQQPVKLWDPRSGNALSTIHGHKGTVMAAKFNMNGNWLITASRDHLCKLFDIRVMKEMYTYRGHKKEATTLALHPIHEDLFATGGSDGSILFWQVDNEREVGSIDAAHDSMVWGLSWHPLGHMLCSGSNDHSTKFWSRNRPGDKMRDRYNLNTLPIGASEEMREYDDDSAVTPVIPGMGLETTTSQDQPFSTESATMEPSAIPGLDSSADEIAQITPKPERKVAYARPVPSEFQREWESKKAPGIAPDLGEQERARRERDRLERRRKEKQRDEEEKRRRDFEREQIRKREKEYQEQKFKEMKEREAREFESLMRDDDDMDPIPGFGPDGRPLENFPMPRAPPRRAELSKAQRRSDRRRARRRERENEEGKRFDGNRDEPPDVSRDRDRRQHDRERSPHDLDRPPRDREGPPHDIDNRCHDGRSHAMDGPPHSMERQPHDADGQSWNGNPSEREHGPGNRDGPRHRDREERSDPRPPHTMGPRSNKKGKVNPNMIPLGTRPPGMMGPRLPEMLQGMGGPRFEGRDSPMPEHPGPQRGGPPKEGSGPRPLMSLSLEGPGPKGLEDEPLSSPREPPMMENQGGPKQGGSSQDDQAGGAGPEFGRSFGGDIDYRHPQGRDGPPGQEGEPRGPPFDPEHSSSGINQPTNQDRGLGRRPMDNSNRGGMGGIPPQQDEVHGGSSAGMGPGQQRSYVEEGRPDSGGSFDREDRGADMDMRQGGPNQRGPHAKGSFQDSNFGPMRKHPSQGGGFSAADDFSQKPNKRDELPDEYSEENNFVNTEGLDEEAPPGGNGYQNNRGRHDQSEFQPPGKRSWGEGPGGPLFGSPPRDGRSGFPRGSRGGGQRGGPRGGYRGGGPRGGFMGRGGRGNRRGRGRGRSGW